MTTIVENNRFIVQVFVGALSQHYEALSVEASKQTTSEEIVTCIVERLSLIDPQGGCYELAEVIGDSTGQECKERRLGPMESPVGLMLLWPKIMHSQQEYYRFYLREKLNDMLWAENFTMDPQLIRDYFCRFLYQPKDREYPDLCQLPELNEQTLLDNLRARFMAGHIYTYVGTILIAVNPFKFHPIYNPKYVKLYQNRRLGPELPPHIFAVADTAYHCMLKERRNQCIVISGESGSGKTESTNFLLHHLTALSQKGSHGSGVEQTILSAGPVLEAFGNATTAHNNNSSRFGKFIQVNYKENGMVHGAVVQKYLLEKSRICSQGRHERNYHVFYYLLAGASDTEKQLLHLRKVEDYQYLSRCGGLPQDSVDEKYEFSRLKQSMEMVGFTAEKQRRLFAVLSAVLLLGNVEFTPRKSAYHHDESVAVRNPEVVALISELLRVKQETLLAALTAKRARASGETLVINYRLPEAFAARDAMAKCLYGALFDWIVLQVNHALLSKKDTLRDHQGNSIGVLDIFGFEDFGLCNSFEQFCINYANEHLQHYFNQHVFKYEQEEYRKEGIRWTDIDFMDNTACLQLIEGKPSGLLCMLDDQCNFPGATNETLLQKFNTVHKDSAFYEIPQRREAAFIVRHYAGKVKYQVAEMREKNLDLMRQDIVGVLKNSSMAFVRELVGADPVAVFRWAIVRAFFRGYFAFHEAGRRHRLGRDGKTNTAQSRYRNHTPNESLISKSSRHTSVNSPNRLVYNYNRQRSSNEENNEETKGSLPGNNHNRLSWPQFHHRNTTTGSGTQQRSSHAKENENKTTKDGNNTQESMRAKRDSLSRQQGALGRVLCPDEAKVMERANQIVMKNKSFRPRERGKKGLKNLQTVKTLAGRTQSYSHGTQLGKARKQPLTVTAQFQHSLHSLMDTLNQADPFFIRCIKSNTKKIPNEFDEETVQRQLRYTGMLETVRIRQAGYNVRLSYDEFIQLYRILLPRGLVSSQSDVRNFLLTLNLNRDNYQLGSSKIFLRESEKVKLDCRLHQQIMASIVTIQRWSRAILERRKFLRFREAAITIQSTWRMVSSQRLLQSMKQQLAAAVLIQAAWRGHQGFEWYRRLQRGSILIQAHVRGHRARARYQLLKRAKDEARRQARADQRLTQSIDDSFLSGRSSQEELDNRPSAEQLDSDASSGIQDENETETHAAPRPKPRTMLINKELPGLVDSSQQMQNVKYSKKKLSSLRMNKDDRLDGSTYQDEQQALAVPERKSSSESLTSQKSVEKDKSRDTLYKAKKQIQALIGVGKKWDGGRSVSSLTDTDIDDANLSASKSAPPIISSSQSRFLDSERVWQKRSDEEDLGPSKLIRGTRVKHEWPTRETPRRELEFKEKARLRSSSSQEEPSSEPPIPIRQRRQRAAARDVVCLSTGPEVADGLITTDSLGTIREAPSLSIDTRAAWRDRSSGDSESSSRYSQEWSPAMDSSSPMSPHVVSTKKSRHVSTSLDLKRRNSDPASNITDQVSLQPSGDSSQRLISDMLEWKGTTMFTIAGHRFGKVARFSKEDKCVYCSEPVDQFAAQGHKCSDCKQLFHIICIQNGGVVSMPCEQQAPSHPGGASASKPGRRKHRKHSRTPYDMTKQAVAGKFSLTGTSEFTDSTDKIISDAKELQLMQDFITKKIYKMESEEGKNPSKVDQVFKEALRQFKAYLVATYSVINKHGFENIKYKDLIANFLHVMETVCTQEHMREDFPVTMYVNAFRGFMNEFMNLTRVEEKPSKAKRKKEKKRKVEDPILFLGHTFLLTIINIPTACEICTSFFMWPIERGLVCQNCKFTCHKKCYSKVAMTCGKDVTSRSLSGGPRVFGVPLHRLAIGDGKVPIVVDRLITTIEMHGLYTEGLYRKSGVSSKVKELKALMDEAPVDGLNFETYAVHVLAAVLKSFLREMPEPLLTFDCYEAFLRAGNLTETHDRISTLFAILKKLPKHNFDLMERLIFHLARVALHEDANRMNPASLAIVFAPCILRTNKAIPAQDSLHDISRQTQCIETIIADQLRKVKSTLADIDTLDTACHTATHRLSSLRSSKIFSPEELLPAASAAAKPDDEDELMNTTEEEALLMGHIEEIQKEKELLTCALPSLRRTTSDDDLLSTDDGSLDDVTMPQDELENDGNASSGVCRKSRQRSLVSRSVSGGEEDAASDDRPIRIKLKTHRQSSSDIGIVTLQDIDADEDPIMV